MNIPAIWLLECLLIIKLPLCFNAVATCYWRRQSAHENRVTKAIYALIKLLCLTVRRMIILCNKYRLDYTKWAWLN